MRGGGLLRGPGAQLYLSAAGCLLTATVLAAASHTPSRPPATLQLKGSNKNFLKVTNENIGNTRYSVLSQKDRYSNYPKTNRYSIGPHQRHR
jgi:hypothetical protein